MKCAFAIIAAILFPVFAQAKEAAKKASCLSNVKQIGIATTLYINDSDDTYPMYQYSYQNDANKSVTVFWWYSATFTSPTTVDPRGGMLQPYLKSYRVSLCPSAAPLLSP